MLIQAPKGTKDVLPSEIYKWHCVEKTIREICAYYGYREMRTPVFEHTELFLRGVGDTTDIVQKEMYTFLDKGGRSITLKPEGTAGFVRSFVEHKLYADMQPTKTYYLSTPVFRYEKPQSGRLREHHQFGIEAFGAGKASMDAEVISVAWRLFQTLGIKGLALNINSIGCRECRPAYNQKLVSYFTERRGELCRTCLDRLDKNPLRILDCKEEKCAKVVRQAPVMTESLCRDCREHFTALQAYLNAIGIPFKVNPFIVRGLDYYTKTVFEYVAEGIGAQGTVCGGGRYDGLVEELGGKPTQGMGFGMGIERLLMVLESQGIDIEEPALCDVYVCAIGEKAEIPGFTLTAKLRDYGVKAECDHTGRSMKAQFKYADKIGARYVAVLGEEELLRDMVKLRDMKNGEERQIARDDIVEHIKKHLK